MQKLLLITLFSITLLQAAPAFSHARNYTQNDGEQFSATLKGDEYLHYLQTADSEIIVFNKESKNYEYALIAKRSTTRTLVPSGIKVRPITRDRDGRANPFAKITQEDLASIYQELHSGSIKIKTH